MNRHERRRKVVMERQDRFVYDYVHYLPEIPVDAPVEPGRVYHVAYYHEQWCKIYDAGSCGLASCNCNPDVRRFVEPKRS
jgi:hypothetical protein